MAKMIDATILKAKLIACKAFYEDVSRGAGSRAYNTKLLTQLVDSLLDEIDSMVGESDDRP